MWEKLAVVMLGVWMLDDLRKDGGLMVDFMYGLLLLLLLRNDI